MSFTQVTKLRKSGQLDEALAMAKADLESDDSPWSYRALFWVLHDMCKQCLDNDLHQEANELVEQMREILPQCEEEEDGVAQKCFNILERRLSPLNNALKQADRESRDDRTVANAFTTVKTILEDETQELDEYQASTAGWIIYRYAKYALEHDDPQSVRRALLLYLELEVEKPSVLHSSILRMAVDLEREFSQDFKFTAFLEKWGFNNLTDEDWERFTTQERRQLPSLAEKAISRYCKELVDDGMHEVPDEFVQLIENARRRLHNDAKIELNYARMLGAMRKVDQAVEIYKKVTQKIPQAYVWQEMADIIPNREMKQAVLCKVITMQQEQFLGDTRLELAQYLIEDGNMAAAKRELDTYRQFREANNWRIDSSYFELEKRIPAGTQASASNNDLYDIKLEKLTGFMYPDATVAVMVYNGKPQKNKKGKSVAKLVASDGTSVSYAVNKLPRHPSRQQCYFYKVKYVKNGERIEPLSVTPVDTHEGLRHFETVSGNLSIKSKPDGKRFGFVGECYVHQSLLGGLTDGQQLQVVATSRDGRKSAAAIL